METPQVALAVILGLPLLALACSPTADRSDQQSPATDGAVNVRAESSAWEVAPATMRDREAEPERPLVLFLGDSLTAGYGLNEDQAFPARVAALLEGVGRPIRVVNAGVSGDTSAGGLSRVDWLLRQQPDVVVVELGANDGLRGLPVEATEANLRVILERILATGARILLVGMQLPPNYGPDYTARFRDLFPRLAAELEVALLPFLLEGVAAEPPQNLPDGLHPNAEGHRRVAETVLNYLEPLLERK